MFAKKQPSLIQSNINLPLEMFWAVLEGLYLIQSSLFYALDQTCLQEDLSPPLYLTFARFPTRPEKFVILYKTSKNKYYLQCKGGLCKKEIIISLAP